MPETITNTSIVRFGDFEVDLQSAELKKNGIRLKLSGQPFQILAILLERPGRLVTREELQKRLWPDTFVDVDHSLGTAVNKLREVLGDSATAPRYLETLPRRGYRFIKSVETQDLPTGQTGPATSQTSQSTLDTKATSGKRDRRLSYFAAAVAMIILGAYAYFFLRHSESKGSASQRSLTRLTFDEGLQIGATWSPDGRYLAYSSNRGGKFDIWVQQVSGGDPIQITKAPGTNWQPDWSPDGRFLAYRSEESGGALFIIPALGGVGSERKIAEFGYYPRWSPDSSQVLFRTTPYLGVNRFYVVGLYGSPPREVLTEFPARHEATVSAAWYPDGKRITVWAASPRWGPDFRTVTLDGGEVVKSVLSPEVDKQLRQVASQGIVEQTRDFAFWWAPSGRAIYCGQTFRGALNLWKMAVDPSTFEVTSIERLTTGPGPDSELSLSRDGSRVAFTAEIQQIRAWLYPFDAGAGKLKGPGAPITPSGMSTWRHSLSRDETRLAFSGNRAGHSQVWEVALGNGATTPIAGDDFIRDSPRWSRDGKRLMYERLNPTTNEDLLVVRSRGVREEVPVCDSTNIEGGYDWLPDDSALLVAQWDPQTNRFGIWQLPVPPKNPAAGCGHKLIADPTYDLHQPNVSPNGRWIVFEAMRDSATSLDSKLYVVPAIGGSWTRITDDKQWADKPRWSPDGRIIYFLSRRAGFFNVWGIHFDPLKGRSIGEAFPVTKLESPLFGMPQHIPSVDLSIGQNFLTITIEQVSGNIWVLDSVGQ